MGASFFDATVDGSNFEGAGEYEEEEEEEEEEETMERRDARRAVVLRDDLLFPPRSDRRRRRRGDGDERRSLSTGRTGRMRAPRGERVPDGSSPPLVNSLLFSPSINFFSARYVPLQRRNGPVQSSQFEGASIYLNFFDRG